MSAPVRLTAAERRAAVNARLELAERAGWTGSLTVHVWRGAIQRLEVRQVEDLSPRPGSPLR